MNLNLNSEERRSRPCEKHNSLQAINRFQNTKYKSGDEECWDDSLSPQKNFEKLSKLSYKNNWKIRQYGIGTNSSGERFSLVRFSRVDDADDYCYLSLTEECVNLIKTGLRKLKVAELI